MTWGRAGEGDFLYIEYSGNRRARFVFDQWGVGGPVGGWFSIVPGKTYTLNVVVGEEALHVFLGNEIIFQISSPMFPLRDVTYGENKIGGGVVRDVFSGVMTKIRE